MWPRFLPKTPEGRRWIFGALLALVVLGSAAHGLGRVWTGGMGDFGHFYGAAHGMLRGENIYTAGHERYIYPPLFAFLIQPLAMLPLATAANIWVLINIVLIFAAALVAGKEIAARWVALPTANDFSIPWGIAAAASVLASDKIHIIFPQGQTDFVILLGFACILRWMERKPLLAGLMIGLTANIKYFSLIFVPYFLLKRNYRAALSSLAACAFFLVLPAVEIGLRRNAEYLAIAGGGLVRMTGATLHIQHLFIPKITWSRSVSVTSAFFRLTRSHGLSDFVAVGLVLLVFAVMVTALFTIARRHGVSLFAPGRDPSSPRSRAIESLEWAILIAIVMVFSPQATERHILLAFLLYGLGAGLLFVEKAKAPRVLLIAALLGMAGATSPPRGIGLDRFLDAWRAIGGAGWCAILLIVAIVWVGCRAIGAPSTLGRYPRTTGHRADQ